MREEKPIALDERGRSPSPMSSSCRVDFEDYLAAHPSWPVLVVEVADTSLALDRLRKGGLYARAGIADYRVVNLIDEVLEVYRKPVATARASRARASRSTGASMPR